MEVLFLGNFTEDQKEKAVTASIFTRWRDSIEKNFSVEKIKIHNIFMFGPRVGFLIVEAVATFEGRPVPGITFLRGDAVSIMPIFTVEGKDELYTAVVTEPRIPIGKNNQTSLPAGMIDGDTFNSAAIKELSEEIGSEISISTDDLINLGKYPLSCGGLDEFMTLMAFRYHLDTKTFDLLNGRQTGCEKENENIKVSIIPFESLPSIQDIDARSHLSYFLWKQLDGSV